jgi:predicted NBD/HSP70 family sugar kinase
VQPPSTSPVAAGAPPAGSSAGRAPVRRDAAIRQATLREHNLALALRTIAHSAVPLSRADLSAITGLTRATTSSLADELIAGGLVREVGPTRRTGAGRPAAGLALADTGPAGLGLEINVDYLAACVVDLTGTVRHSVDRDADLRGRPAAAVVGQLAEVAAEALAAAQQQGLTAAGASVAVPGLVHGGTVRLAPNLDWRDVPLGDLLADARVTAGLPTVVENEANLAAQGEAAHLAPQGPTSFLYISGEIGIGAGIVLDGALFRGVRGWAGELGHLTVEPDGPACHCGSRGCLEQYAGQEAILRAAGAPTGNGQSALRLMQDRAGAGDAAMLAGLRRAGGALGVAVAGAVNLLDVRTVVLGGGYAALEPWLRPWLEQELATRAVTAGWAPVTVRPSALGTRATVVGAARTALRGVLDHPARWLATR